MRALLDIISYPFQLVFLAPAALLGAPRWLKSLSLATRVALVVFVFMLLFTTFSAAYYLLGFQGREAPDLLTWARKSFIPPLILTFLTPPVVYLAVRFWLEGQVSRFPDIDAAWKEGVAAVEKAGITLNQVPVFLVLGMRDERSVRALMRATGIKYAVQGIPEGNNYPLHFYAAIDEKIAGSEERLTAVYIFAVDACRSSKLHQLGAEPTRARNTVDDTVRADSMRGTMVGGGGDVSRGTSLGNAPPADSLRGTLVGGGANQPVHSGTVHGGSMSRGADERHHDARRQRQPDHDAAGKWHWLRHCRVAQTRGRLPRCPARISVQLDLSQPGAPVPDQWRDDGHAVSIAAARR
jgi:hypothetical protein